MKFMLPRASLDAWASLVAGSAPAFSQDAKQHVHIVRSGCAGLGYIVRRLRARGIAVVLSRLRLLVSDEPIAAMIVRHLELNRLLNRRARQLVSRHPNYVNKYASEYIAKSFNKCTRREILAFHHTYLASHVDEAFYDEILEGRVLWGETINGNSYVISMAFNPERHHEGDLSLIFNMNNVPIYEINFSIVPGKDIGSPANAALLIGNVQGKSGQADAIKTSAKTFDEIAPPYLLLAAVAAVAKTLGIDVVAGVSNAEQLAKAWKHVGSYFDYDAFWETVSLTRNSANIYEGPIPLPEKPIETIRTDHRRRVRRKRRLKKQIAECVAVNFAEQFIRPEARAIKSFSSKSSTVLVGVFSTDLVYQVSELLAFA